MLDRLSNLASGVAEEHTIVWVGFSQATRRNAVSMEIKRILRCGTHSQFLVGQTVKCDSTIGYGANTALLNGNCRSVRSPHAPIVPIQRRFASEVSDVVHVLKAATICLLQ
jgi:hypothetical protein